MEIRHAIKDWGQLSEIGWVFSLTSAVEVQGPRLFTEVYLDGPAIRNANRGDSRESIRRKKPIFITRERFARIASNLQFALFSPPKARFAR